MRRLKAICSSKTPQNGLNIFLEMSAIRSTGKNSVGETTVLTASSRHGLVSQLDYYKKSVSAENLSGYYLLKKGEFVYNRSSSAGYPYGSIKRLDAYSQGVVSTLNLCFAISGKIECDSDFMAHAFESGILNNRLVGVCQEGARSHGLLNITKSDFFGLKFLLPSISKQKQIAEILDTARREDRSSGEARRGLPEGRSGGSCRSCSRGSGGWRWGERETRTDTDNH